MQNEAWVRIVRHPLVTAVSLAGFLGLLLAGNAVPTTASVSRGLALSWYVAFGVLRCGLDWKR